MSDGEFFSSTGDVGREVRQDNRLYENAHLYDLHPFMLAERFADLLEDPRGTSENISRWVLRGIVHDEVVADIQAEADPYGLRDALEVAVPLDELGYRGWLIYLARNTEEREAGAHGTDTMMAATATQEPARQSPLSRVENVADQGYELRAIPGNEDAARLAEDLWGPIFGWDRPQVDAIINRLETEQEKPRAERELFFTGLYSGNLLVGAAMAETLELLASGRKVPLVESTEWCMDEAHRGRGLMPAVLANLNAQIIQAFAERGKRPLIYSECNFTSRSDRAGNAAGFRIPSRQFATQCLRRHVTVNDGIGPDDELRDFSFMHLPASTFSQDGSPYDTGQVDRMLSRATEESLL